MTKAGMDAPTTPKSRLSLRIFKKNKDEDAVTDVPTVDDNDSENDPGLGAMDAPGQHYTTAEEDRGRGLLRKSSSGKGSKSRSRSRSRSNSVSRALRRLVSGKKSVDGDEERSVSRRGGRKPSKEAAAESDSAADNPPIPRTIQAFSDTAERTSEVPVDKGTTAKQEESQNVDDAFISEEGSIGLASSTKKKKKLSKKKKDSQDDDDDTGSRSSHKKKRSSRKKKTSEDASVGTSTHGDETTASKRKKRSSSKKATVDREQADNTSKDDASHSVRSKKRTSKKKVPSDGTKTKSKKKKESQEVNTEFGDSKSHGWEAEEHLLTPTPQKEKILNDSFGDLAGLSIRKSARSMVSDVSSAKKSTGVDSNDSAVLSVSALTSHLREKDIENRELQKKLEKALKKLASRNEDIRKGQLEKKKMRHELTNVKREMASVSEQNKRLHKSLDTVENELSTKEDRIDALEEVVEKQLDAVELLEQRLDDTEEELFKMEKELNVLEVKENLDQSLHSRGRLAKVNSIRANRLQRMESKKDVTQGESVRDMINNSLDKSTHHQRASELSSRERKLQEKERKIQLQRERDDSRETRLEEWESELAAREKKIQNETRPAHVQLQDKRDDELDDRERRLNEREKRLHQIQSEFEANSKLTGDEKDEIIAHLKAECEDLIVEKEDVVRRFEEEEQQREEDLKEIQDDINEKMKALEIENKNLRQLTAAMPGDKEECFHTLQKEVSKQLAELDSENRKLNNRLVEEQKSFQEKLNEKDLLIVELEEMLEELEKDQESKHAKPENGEDNQVTRDLAGALEVSEEKQAEIDMLRTKLSQITLDFEERNTRELSSKDATIEQLRNELEATRAVIEAKTSDQLSMQLKSEVRKMKDVIRDLNTRIKSDQNNSKALLRKKDDSLKALEYEVARLKRELERLEKRDQDRAAAKTAGAEGDVKQHIADLEEEIDHWKSLNYELEDELVHWKKEAHELKEQLDEDGGDESASLASMTSGFSKVSKPSTTAVNNGTMNSSHHSFSSLSKEDLFFVSGPGAASASSSSIGQEDNSNRAMRTVTDLWSKMTKKQPPAPSNGLYQMNFND